MISRVLFSLSLLAIIFIGPIYFLGPIKFRDLIFSTQLKLQGFKFTQQSGYEFIERDNCQISENCQCVIFFHGLLDRALTWKKVLSDKEFLKNNYYLVAVNLPGAGQTVLASDSNDLKVSQVAQTVHRIMNNKCHQPIVVGNSFGGWVAFHYAVANEQTKALVLVNSAGLKSEYDVLKFYLNMNSSSVRELHRRAFSGYTKYYPEFIYSWIASELKKVPVEQVLTAQASEEDMLNFHINKLTKKVALVWGEDDKIMPEDFWEQFQHLLGDRLLYKKKVHKCGHIPQAECPDEIVAAIRVFM